MENHPENTDLDSAFPVLMACWNQPTPENRELAALAVYMPLAKMQKLAQNMLPVWIVNRIHAIGLEDPKTTILLKLLEGPGKKGIGNYSPAKGKISGWVWRMMVRHSISLARKASARKYCHSELGGDEDKNLKLDILCHSRWKESAKMALSAEKRKRLLALLESYLEDHDCQDILVDMARHVRENGAVPKLREQAQNLGITTAKAFRLRQAAFKKVMNQRRLNTECPVFGELAV